MTEPNHQSDCAFANAVAELQEQRGEMTATEYVNKRLSITKKEFNCRCE